jgi:hypothetical protein
MMLAFGEAQHEPPTAGYNGLHPSQAQLMTQFSQQLTTAFGFVFAQYRRTPVSFHLHNRRFWRVTSDTTRYGEYRKEN